MTDFRVNPRESENLRQQGVFDSDTRPHQLVGMEVLRDRAGSRVIRLRFEHTVDAPYSDAPELARLLEAGEISIEQASEALQQLRDEAA